MKMKIGSMTLDVLPPVKRYMNAIERRLNTDRKTRTRIMVVTTSHTVTVWLSSHVASASAVTANSMTSAIMAASNNFQVFIVHTSKYYYVQRASPPAEASFPRPLAVSLYSIAPKRLSVKQDLPFH